jgi:hypothetical protein
LELPGLLIEHQGPRNFRSLSVSQEKGDDLKSELEGSA